jgi:hypothetical protein
MTTLARNYAATLARKAKYREAAPPLGLTPGCCRMFSRVTRALGSASTISVAILSFNTRPGPRPLHLDCVRFSTHQPAPVDGRLNAQSALNVSTQSIAKSGVPDRKLHLHEFARSTLTVGESGG